MREPADADWLESAAKLALRGHGGAEPNPMVGCVIVQSDDSIVGWGYHARCGELHAEAVALKRAGTRAKGATAFVTLEPCAHQGKTPPCCDALIKSGVARVVYAVADPNPLAAGGADRMRAAGISVEQINSDACARVSAPFLTRIRSKRPWIIAKWAQTIDGRTATRAGDSRWISSAQSRAMVHRERGRVDAVMVGIGTVFADNPHLLPRTSRSRRIPRRIIVDPRLVTPSDAQVVRTVSQGPVAIAALSSSIHEMSEERREDFATAGVTFIELSGSAMENAHRSFRGLPKSSMTRLMQNLHTDGVSNVLVEGGAGLLGALFDEDLVDDAWCFTAPLAIADGAGAPIATGEGRTLMIDALRYELLDLRRRADDSMALWRRKTL
jgi:diaminohydroxyphosphoribosylaminopyrimidine deaminase/5-amino-6-(5-phosphoribosylamino)uracil reductase